MRSPRIPMNHDEPKAHAQYADVLARCLFFQTVDRGNVCLLGIPEAGWWPKPQDLSHRCRL